MLKIAISGIHGDNGKVLADRLCKVLEKSIGSGTKLFRMSADFDTDLREDLGEMQTKAVTLAYIEREMDKLCFSARNDELVVFDRSYVDVAIYYLAAKAMREGEMKPPKRAKLEQEVIQLLTEANSCLFVNQRYDIIIFNRLPKRQYELSVINDPLRSQTIEFRNLVNDFFCNLYTPYLGKRSKLFPRTRIVTNANPFGCKCSVSSFMRNLIGNEILPVIC